MGPELLQITLGEGTVEVFLNVNAKETGDTDGDVAEAGEVEVEIGAETGYRDRKVDPMMGEAVG